MQFSRLEIPDVIVLTPNRHGDERGFFSETFNVPKWEKAGITCSFVQDNHSLSRARHVLRGLHFQTPPHAQDKLVRVTRGAVLDVVVDIRRGSPSYGKSVSALLSADNWRQLWAPKGFAHGFLTLEPDTEFLYKVTDRYAPECEAGLAWNDPALGIDWGLPEGVEPALSAKDARLSVLADLPACFIYDPATGIKT